MALLFASILQHNETMPTVEHQCGSYIFSKYTKTVVFQQREFNISRNKLIEKEKDQTFSSPFFSDMSIGLKNKLKKVTKMLNHFDSGRNQKSYLYWKRLNIIFISNLPLAKIFRNDGTSHVLHFNQSILNVLYFIYRN